MENYCIQKVTDKRWKRVLVAEALISVLCFASFDFGFYVAKDHIDKANVEKIDSLTEALDFRFQEACRWNDLGHRIYMDNPTAWNYYMGTDEYRRLDSLLDGEWEDFYWPEWWDDDHNVGIDPEDYQFRLSLPLVGKELEILDTIKAECNY